MWNKTAQRLQKRFIRCLFIEKYLSRMHNDLLTALLDQPILRIIYYLTRLKASTHHSRYMSADQLKQAGSDFYNSDQRN